MRGETLTPNPNECNSTLTSGTSGIIYTRNTNVQSLNLIASSFKDIRHYGPVILLPYMTTSKTGLWKIKNEQIL